MARQMQVDGMEEISRMLEQMEESAPAVAAQALYEGAKVMREAIQEGAEAIRTEPFRYERNGTRLPSPEEKEIVVAAGVGVAKFDKNGSEVDTSVGYRNAGYAELGGKTKPVPQIVNAINSGTSFMQKQPFVRKAERNGRQRAEAAITRRIQEAYDNMNKK